jgi:hypothetical protein
MSLVVHPHLLPLLGSDVAFGVIFGIFALALLTLIVIVIRWAFRHDKAGRAAWKQRQLDRQVPPGGPGGRAAGAAAAEGETPPAPR